MLLIETAITPHLRFYYVCPEQKQQTILCHAHGKKCADFSFDNSFVPN